MLIHTCIPSSVNAEEFVDKIAYEVIIEKNQDVIVTETITLKNKASVKNFTRVLPKRIAVGGGASGVSYSINFSLLNDNPCSFSVLDQGDYLSVRLGDAERSYSGALNYVLQYKLTGALHIAGDSATLRLLFPGKWEFDIETLELLYRLPPFMLADSVKTSFTMSNFKVQQGPTPLPLKWNRLTTENDREVLGLAYRSRIPARESMALELTMPASFFNFKS